MPSLLPHTVGDIARFFKETVLTGRNWYDLSRNYRNFFSVTLFKSRLEKISRNSEKFTFSYLINGYRNGQYDSYFQPDSINRQNVGLKGEAYWTMYKTHMAFDRREPDMSSGAGEDRIANHLKMQEQNMWNGLYEDMEEAFWTLPTAPNDGTAGDPVPWGVPYSVVKSSTAAVGQNGGAPSGYTTVYGNSRTTYPQLKNYTGTIAAVDHTEFVVKCQDMIDLMHWEAPRDFANEIKTNDNFEIVSHRTPLQEYRTLLTQSNQNLGYDAGKFRGGAPSTGAVLLGIPWNWSDALTRQYMRDGSTPNPAYDSDKPIYFLNWDSWTVFAASDYWMKVSDPIEMDDPHNSVAIWIDSMANTICLDPGKNGVLKYA